jgi:hypothetical protein
VQQAKRGRHRPPCLSGREHRHDDGPAVPGVLSKTLPRIQGGEPMKPEQKEYIIEVLKGLIVGSKAENTNRENQLLILEHLKEYVSDVEVFQ